MTFLIVVSLVVGACSNTTPRETLILTSTLPPTPPIDDLVDELVRSGASASVLSGGDTGSSLWTTDPHELCVDGQTVSVWFYRTPGDLNQESQAIAPDATSIAGGNIDASGQYRFYASGSVLAFYHGFDEGVRETLATVLGATITPDAKPRGAFGGSVDPEAVDAELACDVG